MSDQNKDTQEIATVADEVAAQETPEQTVVEAVTTVANTNGKRPAGDDGSDAIDAPKAAEEGDSKRRKVQTTL